MLDCRYYDLCCFTDGSCNGEPECPKRDHCQFYSPMPDVNALLALANDLCDGHPYGLCHGGLEQLASRIREACGEVVG